MEKFKNSIKMSEAFLPGSFLSDSCLFTKTREVSEMIFIPYFNQKSKELINYLVTAGDDHLISIWNLKDFNLIRSWNGSQLPITGLLYLEDGEKILIMTSSYSHVIQIWDFWEGDIPIQSLTMHTSDVCSLIYVNSKEYYRNKL